MQWQLPYGYATVVSMQFLYFIRLFCCSLTLCFFINNNIINNLYFSPFFFLLSTFRGFFSDTTYMLFSFYFRDPKINNDNSTIQRQTRAHALRFVFRETSGDIVELKATRTTTTMMMTCPRVRSIKNGSKSGIHFISDIGATIKRNNEQQCR